MNKPVQWNEHCEQSFVAFKKILQGAPVLNTPVDGVPFVILTDASKYGIGGALAQRIDGKLRYVMFASKALNSGQRKYSATRRELLGVCFALKRFREFVYGTKFTLYTDHRGLDVHVYSEASE